MKNIVLVGFATSGKTTVGKLLAQQLGLQFVDVDEQIVQLCGDTIANVFQQKGELFFRRTENTVVEQLCQTQNTVVACGGGSVLAPKFSALAQNSTVVWLQIDTQTAFERIDQSRPLFWQMHPKQLAQTMETRNFYYQTFAKICIDANGKTPQQIVEEICKAL
ncbi:MAG: shikimate kinase [Clostridia bacterium]|nr:shikimate kinase [Clostridia bacterium]